jgi:hypothetical protein
MPRQLGSPGSGSASITSFCRISPAPHALVLCSIIGFGHLSRWQFFASGPKIRKGFIAYPPSTMRLKPALRFCVREAPRDQHEKIFLPRRNLFRHSAIPVGDL